VLGASTVMFRVNGTSQWSTWTCDAKPFCIYICVQRVLAARTHPGSGHAGNITVQVFRGHYRGHYDPGLRI